MVASQTLIQTLIQSGLLITLLVIVFKAGQWKRDNEQTKNDLSDAHQMLHRDIGYLVNEVNGIRTSNRENCPICSEVDEE
jgi:hypothetical protein